MLIAFFSDKYRHRSGFILLAVGVCILGVSLTAFASNNEVRYFGMSMNLLIARFLLSALRCFPDQRGQLRRHPHDSRICESVDVGIIIRAHPIRRAPTMWYLTVKGQSLPLVTRNSEFNVLLDLCRLP